MVNHINYRLVVDYRIIHSGRGRGERSQLLVKLRIREQSCLRLSLALLARGVRHLLHLGFAPVKVRVSVEGSDILPDFSPHLHATRVAKDISTVRDQPLLEALDAQPLLCRVALVQLKFEPLLL